MYSQAGRLKQPDTGHRRQDEQLSGSSRRRPTGVLIFARQGHFQPSSGRGKLLPVDDNTDRLHNLLLEVAHVLRTDEPAWSSAVARFGQRLIEAGMDRDGRQRVVRDVLGLYRQGMGGFQDIVLQRDGAVFA